MDEGLIPMTTIVYHSNFPWVFRAFTIIDQDNGRINRCEPAKTEYGVPWDHQGLLRPADYFLSTLSEYDFEEFCIGDSEYAERMAMQSPTGAAAKRLLNLYFDAWEES